MRCSACMRVKTQNARLWKRATRMPTMVFLFCGTAPQRELGPLQVEGAEIGQHKRLCLWGSSVILHRPQHAAAAAASTASSAAPRLKHVISRSYDATVSAARDKIHRSGKPSESSCGRTTPASTDPGNPGGQPVGGNAVETPVPAEPLAE